jgi:hypothetical protein
LFLPHCQNTLSPLNIHPGMRRDFPVRRWPSTDSSEPVFMFTSFLHSPCHCAVCSYHCPIKHLISPPLVFMYRLSCYIYF